MTELTQPTDLLAGRSCSTSPYKDEKLGLPDNLSS
jgi:hypothetical protein